VEVRCEGATRTHDGIEILNGDVRVFRTDVADKTVVDV
jgi:hypothetical protein